jgi:PadR family transcriptional regulator PadR
MELLPGTLHLLILRTLANGPLHGYAMARRIKETSAGLLQIEEGSLYPALSRLLVKGWIKGEWGLSETNRTAKFYTLTKAGRKQLGQESAEFRSLVAAIEMVLQKA